MCLLFVKTVVVINKSTEGGGGGGNPLYLLYRCVRRQRVWFFIFFGLKKGINFDQFGLGMFF